MSVKQNEKNTTTGCRDITPGDRLTIGGVEFAVLDKRPDGSVFVVAVKNQFESQFGHSNDYFKSHLRYATENWLHDWVEKNVIDWAHILPREIDLTTLDGHKYGKEMVTVAPLTMDEARQYAKIIPDPDDWSWLITGWDAPRNGAKCALLVYSDGDWGHSGCYSVSGVRPAMVLSPEFFDPDKEYKVPEEAAGSLDDQPVHILVRDCNGKRQTISFDNAAACVAELSSEDQTVIDCENDEILLVALGDMVLYCQLTGGGLDAEDIVGFFA